MTADASVKGFAMGGEPGDGVGVGRRALAKDGKVRHRSGADAPSGWRGGRLESGRASFGDGFGSACDESMRVRIVRSGWGDRAEVPKSLIWATPAAMSTPDFTSNATIRSGL
jgi:hypothetical protein